MKRILFIIIILSSVAASAQRITRDFNNVTMPEALRQLNRMQQRYTINFIFNDLEDFRVTTSVKGKTVPESIRQLIGFYPIEATIIGDSIINVECTQKTSVRYKGRVVDASGQPIEFANVALLSPNDSSLINGGVTNASGYFVIPCEAHRVIARVSYVGFKPFERIYSSPSIGIIHLITDHIILKGVTIKGERHVFRQKEGNIVTQVQGTVLSRLSNIDDLLTQIPRVVKGRSGGIEVFGKGVPVIYINERKIRSNEELQRIDPSNIKQIELITAPGTKYDAEGNAVINITTLNNPEGFSLLAKGEMNQNEECSYSQSTSIGYQHKNLCIMGYYNYQYDKNRFDQPNSKEISIGKNLHRYDIAQQGMNKIPKLTTQISIDYAFNNKNNIGVLWDANTRTNKEARYEDLVYYLNDVKGQTDAIDNKYKNKVTFHHVNAFYNWKAEKSELNINTDYVYNSSDYNQETQEDVDELSRSNTLSNGGSKQKMYAIKLDYDLSLRHGIKLSLGGEANYMHATGNLTISSMVFANTAYSTRENRNSMYTEFIKTTSKFNITCGIRYEDYSYKYNSHLDDDNLHKHYRNIFPNIKLSYIGIKWNHTLSFNSQITRPTFRQLSNSNYYGDKYTYQHGNPKLVPAKKYNVQLYSSYRYFSFSVGYSYQDKFIAPFFQNEENSNVIVTTYKNFNNIQHLTFNAGVQKKFGFWNPSFNIGIDQPFFKYDYRGKIMHHNETSLYFALNQHFTLPKDIMISSYVYYNSGETQGAVKLRPFHSINMSIQKSFFINKLTIGLKGNDLFHGMKFKEKVNLQNVYFKQTEDYHLWNFSLFVNFKLNSKKGTYKGKNSLNDDIKRL